MKKMSGRTTAQKIKFQKLLQTKTLAKFLTPQQLEALMSRYRLHSYRKINYLETFLSPLTRLERKSLELFIQNVKANNGKSTKNFAEEMSLSLAQFKTLIFKATLKIIFQNLDLLKGTFSLEKIKGGESNAD